MTPIILSQEIASVPSALQSSVDHRDEILALCAPITEVKTHDQLEAAVKVLASLAGILKETEEARTTVKRPVLDLGKAIDKVAADFVEKVEKETLRLKGYVNHFQTLQLREKEERERKAREEAAKAQREAEAAQREIERLQREAESKKQTEAEKAKNEEAILDAQLRAESASLAAQNAEAQLSVPTNTPRGMTTRSRYNFQILNPAEAYGEETIQWWLWRADEECIKFDRAGFLKFLNSDDHTKNADWIPCSETNPTGSILRNGIRIFRDVSVSVRG